MCIRFPRIVLLACISCIFLLASDAPTASALFGENAAPAADQEIQDKVILDANDWLYGPANAAANHSAIASLQKPASINVENEGFGKVVDGLARATGANFFVNWKVLEAAGIDRNTQVTVKLRDVPAYKILDLALSEVGGGTANLDWSLDSGIITISTRDDLSSARYQLVLVYDTRDILNKPESKESLDDRVRNLIETIQSVVAPDSWRINGGTIGGIRELNGQLFINQTSSNHRTIYRYLDQIRAATGIATHAPGMLHAGASFPPRTASVPRTEQEQHDGRGWGTPRAPDVPTLNMLGGHAYESGK